MTSTQKADTLFKLLAANGYIISQIDKLKHEGSYPVAFKGSYEHTARKFYKECVQVESQITGVDRGDSEDKDAALSQLHDSYVLIDKIMDLVLIAGRKLTHEANLLFNEELETLAAKYGVSIT